jgi:hypothetical protein
MTAVISLALTFFGVLAKLIGPLAMRVLLACGVSFVTYKGAGTSVDWILNSIRSSTGGMPAQAAGLLGFLWVDKAISMMFGAFTASLAVKAVNGSISRMVIGGKK